MSNQARIAMQQAQPAQETGQIHQQQYQRYNGPRREQAGRFWIVARNTVKLGIRRVATILSLIATVMIIAISMVFMWIRNLATKAVDPSQLPPGLKDPLAPVIVSPGAAVWWLGWWAMVLAAA